jgi:hypothetical protein
VGDCRQLAQFDQGCSVSRHRIRWASGFTHWTAACGLSVAAAHAAGAQTPAPDGVEFQVNTYATSYQVLPSVAAGDDGDFVVVWASMGSSGTDTSSQCIQGQRYASDGSAQGTQFQVNTYTTGYQSDPSVSADSDGDFVVVWSSFGSSGTDTGSHSIQGQHFASDGSTQGAQFQVNAYTTGDQRRPSVATDDDGDFVVVWDSYGSFGTDTTSVSAQGQRYASDGSLRGAQFQVNSYTTSFQYRQSLAVDADGDFVVVWWSCCSSGTDTSDSSIQGQRYASDGSPQGAEFQVNTYTTSTQMVPTVAADADGDFVVLWMGASGPDPSDANIRGQRYASDGSTQDGEFQVNTYTTDNQGDPSVMADANGGFVVVWASYGTFGTDTSETSIQGQRYGSDGSTQGGEFQVNSYTTSHQGNPSVAVRADGDFVVVWWSYGSFETDSSATSIQGQRYGVAAPAAVVTLSPATRLALGAALLLGAGFALRVRAPARSPSRRAGRW